MTLLSPLMIDIEGYELSPEDREILSHPLVSGVVLFKRNYHSPAQVIELTKNIRALQEKPFLIAVDQEGGRVQRFGAPSFVTLPPLEKIGNLYNTSKEQAFEFASLHAKTMAQEILACGIDISFAPVLDLNFAESRIISDRAFSSDPIVCVQLAKSYISALHSVGMAATGKHFPGHGTAVADSHLEDTIDNRSFEILEKNDLRVFSDLADQLDAVMMAHILYPDCDSNLAGFSKFWMQTVLREKYNFKGLIFSDDLSMKGAGTATTYQDRTLLALEAGCDMVLICNSRLGVIEVLDNLNFVESLTFESRLSNMLAKKHYDWSELHTSQAWKQQVKELHQWM